MDPELLKAVHAYKSEASHRLEPRRLELAIRLLKELHRQLGQGDLLHASLQEIKAAGARVLAKGELREHSKFLSAELVRFFDAALAAGCIGYHPIRKTARLTEEPGPERRFDVRAAGARAAELVAGVLADGIQQGLMISPLAAPLADLGGSTGPVDRLFGVVSGRWQRLAARMGWLLELARIAIPAATLVLAVSAAFDSGNPFTAAYGSALESGQAVQHLEIAVNLLANEGRGTSKIGSLTELGDRVGVPLDDVAEVFELQRATVTPPILYLRHRKTGTLVVLTPERRASLRHGRWKVLR